MASMFTWFAAIVGCASLSVDHTATHRIAIGTPRTLLVTPAMLRSLSDVGWNAANAKYREQSAYKKESFPLIRHGRPPGNNLV